MSLAPQPGVFLLSIDVPASARPDVWQLAEDAQQCLAAVRCPATWNLGDASTAEFADAIRATEVAHELGLWGDAAWAGNNVRRHRVAEELKRHVELARTIGFAPTSLAIGRGQVTAHLDLLVKHGITAVRSDVKRADATWWRRLGGGGNGAAVNSLRWGLWNFSGAVEPLMHGVPRTVRAVEFAAARGGLVHVVVGLTEAVGGGRSLRSVERVLRHAAELAERRRLVFQTVSQITGRLRVKHRATPARSILRKAA